MCVPVDIFVPPEQVIDTVDLYYLEHRQRRLSLRFLTWFVLKENIQTDTHDSIEDALSALKLYKVHLQLEAEGSFDSKLEEVYRDGRKYVCHFVLTHPIVALIVSLLPSQNYKPPLPSTQSSTPTPASGTSSPMPQIAIGRGAFLPQPQYGAHFPLNAIATPPFLPMPPGPPVAGPSHHNSPGHHNHHHSHQRGFMQANWRNPNR